MAKTDPKNIDAYFYKLGAQFEIGDMEGVLKTTDAMIKNNPDDPIGYEMRSYIKGQEGDLAGAIEDLDKAVELEPDPEYVAYIEMELADLKFQEAEVETEAEANTEQEVAAKANVDTKNGLEIAAENAIPLRRSKRVAAKQKGGKRKKRSKNKNHKQDVIAK